MNTPDFRLIKNPKKSKTMANHHLLASSSRLLGSMIAAIGMISTAQSAFARILDLRQQLGPALEIDQPGPVKEPGLVSTP